MLFKGSVISPIPSAAGNFLLVWRFVVLLYSVAKLSNYRLTGRLNISPVHYHDIDPYNVALQNFSYFSQTYKPKYRGVLL
jgi:hypothetical protein